MISYSLPGESQSEMTRLTLLNDIYNSLESTESLLADHYVHLLLLDSICENNPCCQELISTSGCITPIMNMFG